MLPSPFLAAAVRRARPSVLRGFAARAGGARDGTSEAGFAPPAAPPTSATEEDDSLPNIKAVFPKDMNVFGRAGRADARKETGTDTLAGIGLSPSAGVRVAADEVRKLRGQRTSGLEQAGTTGGAVQPAEGEGGEGAPADVRGQGGGARPPPSQPPPSHQPQRRGFASSPDTKDFLPPETHEALQAATHESGTVEALARAKATGKPLGAW